MKGIVLKNLMLFFIGLMLCSCSQRQGTAIDKAVLREPVPAQHYALSIYMNDTVLLSLSNRKLEYRWNAKVYVWQWEYR